MIKNGRTFRNDVKIVRRGLKEFNKLMPGQMKHIYLRSFLMTLILYIPVVLSAIIIDELLTIQRMNWLILYSVLGSVFVLLLSIVKIAEDKKIAVGYSHLFSGHEIGLTNRSYELEYELLENTEVIELRDRVSGSINVSGAGMASLYWDMDILVTNGCSVCIAIILCSSFLKDIIRWDFSVNGSLSTSFGIILGILTLIIICSMVSCKMTSKKFDANYDVFVDGAKYNRYGEFYTIDYLSNEDAALDTRIFGQKDLIIQEAKDKCYSKFAEGKRKEMRATNKYDGIRLFCSYLCGCVVYLAISEQAMKGVVSAGSIVMIYSAVTMLINALSDIAQIITDLRNNNLHLLNYFAYIDLKNANDNNKYGEQIPESVHEIAFRNLSFQYPGTEDYVLKNVNLTIKQDEKIALVGENGSGKTTIIKLLCRLYKPTEGEICINGKNINEFGFDEYIKLISTVFQDFSLFSFTVAENIAISKEYDEKEIWSCIQKVGLEEKIKSYDLGIQQSLFNEFDESGVEMSGGEEQRLAIARSIYKKSEIMVLDEPTSALDPITESEIYKKFAEITKGKVTLFISHRLSSCKMADRIMVFDKGSKIQEGTHEALLQDKDNKYAEMWNAQAQYYQ